MKQKSNKKPLLLPRVDEITTWLPAKLIVSLIVGWAVFVIIKYYGSDKFAVNLSALDMLIDGVFNFNFFHSYFLKVCFSAILAVWIFFVSVQIGVFLLSLVPTFKREIIDEDKYGEKLPFSLGLGLVVISSITLLLGFVGLYYRWVFYVILILLSSIAVWNWRTKKTTFKFCNFSSNKIAWLVVGFLLFVNLIGSFVPEIFYDSISYHIGVQNYYIQNHGIVSMPTNLFSALPMNMEMLYTFAILLSDELLSKMMHFITCIGVVITLVSFGKRYLTEKAGLLASVFYISMPMVAINVWTTAVDIGQTFFQLLSFYVLFNSLLCNEASQKRNLLVLSAIFTGFTMGIKYTAFTILPISLVLLVWYKLIKQKSNLKVILSEVILYGTISFVMILPWFAKNYTYHKNPIYPFLGTHFGEPNIDQQRWNSFCGIARNVVTALKTTDSRKRLLLHPWILTMEGGSNADFVGPIFLVFLPLLFLIKLKSIPLQLIRFYFILNWVAWLSNSEYLRYLLSGLAFLAILLSGVIEKISTGDFYKKVFRFLCYFMAMGGAFWSLVVFQNTGGWLVLTGKMTKQDYLSSLWPSYPYPPYAAYNYINKNFEKDAKILILGDAKSYYLERNHVVQSVFDYPLIVKWCEDSKDENDVFNRFKKERITHIFFNYFEARRTAGYGLFSWNESSWAIFEKFWQNHVELVWSDVDVQNRKNPRALFIYAVKERSTIVADNVLREWRPKKN